MSLLSGKKILLGVSGGIAAYKSPHIVRLFKSHGAEVRVVMTPSAKDFVTPLTLSTLSDYPVCSTFTEQLYENPIWNDHVAIGKWADLTFLDVDILNATPEEILKGQVLKTLINEKVAFEK